MPQTQDAISAANMKVETSTDGVTFTDIGGFASSVQPDGGDRKVGEGFTFMGDTPLLTKGKRESVTLKVTAAYTEGASEPYRVVEAAYEAGSDFWVRWSPAGGLSGDRQYTAKGIIITAPYPGGEAENEDPIMLEFDLKASSITPSTVA